MTYSILYVVMCIMIAVVKRGPRSPLTFANATDALRRGTDGQEESSKVDKAEVSGKSGGSAWKLEEHPAESTKLRNHVLYECRSFCCACAAFEAIFSRVHLLQFRCFLFLVRSVELHDPAGYMGGWS